MFIDLQSKTINNMKKILIMLAIASSFTACKKVEMDTRSPFCKLPLPIETKVQFKEKQHNTPGFNQFKIYVMPLTIRRVLGGDCYYTHYLLTDANGDSVKVYSGDLKKW